MVEDPAAGVDLAESIDQQANRTTIEDGAANLRDLLRKFV